MLQKTMNKFLLLVFTFVFFIADIPASPGSEYDKRRDLLKAAVAMQNDKALAREIFSKYAAEGDLSSIQALKLLDDNEKQKAAQIKAKEKRKAEKEYRRKRSSVAKLPKRMDSHYLVGSSGRVSQLGGYDSDLSVYIKLRSKLDEEMGKKINDKTAQSRYDRETGIFSHRTLLISSDEKKPGFSHCGGNGEVYSNWSEYSVKSVSLSEGMYSTETWTLTNKNPQGICQYPVVSSLTCKV